MLFVVVEIAGHALWLAGVIPDNNTGGDIVYVYLPALWLLATVILVARKFTWR